MQISFHSLAKLLRARIVSNNKNRKKKVKVRDIEVYKKLIEEYFNNIFREAVLTGDAIIFPFVGNLQVITKISKKGYEWDKLYKGRDFELIIHTNKKVNIKTDEVWYDKILRAAERGVVYKPEVRNPVEALHEIVSLLTNGKPVTKTKRFRDKVVA